MSDCDGFKDIRLQLNTIENTRKSMARLIRMKFRGEIERTLFRDLMYGFSHFLSAWKLEKDVELEERLDSIEAELKELGKFK